jgi:hypothetical protein
MTHHNVTRYNVMTHGTYIRTLCACGGGGCRWLGWGCGLFKDLFTQRGALPAWRRIGGQMPFYLAEQGTICSGCDTCGTNASASMVVTLQGLVCGRVDGHNWKALGANLRHPAAIGLLLC